MDDNVCLTTTEMKTPILRMTEPVPEPENDDEEDDEDDSSEEGGWEEKEEWGP